MRESYLNNLLKLSRDLDDLYWKYVYLRIKDKKLNKSGLKNLKTKIFQRQHELSVGKRNK